MPCGTLSCSTLLPFINNSLYIPTLTHISHNDDTAAQHVRHSEGTYRDEIIAKILFMCSKEKFGLMTDFAWYASVLLDLAVMQGKKLEGRRRVWWLIMC
jgi:hypothetical protein